MTKRTSTTRPSEPVYWLSYGGGVNSTALAVLLCQKDPRLEKYWSGKWRLVWSDTRDEKDETYEFIYQTFIPYLQRHGKVLEVVCDHEGVFERWWRMGVVGRRVNRSCTHHAKIRPIIRHLKGHARRGEESRQLIGIDAGEAHRAKPSYTEDDYQKDYPLVDLDIDREGCQEIIEAAGLQPPVKSGCWHCPFMRVGEILELSKKNPGRFQKIVSLEKRSMELLPVSEGKVRAQWGEKPALDWAARACAENSSGPLFQEIDPDPPCGCYDG